MRTDARGAYIAGSLVLVGTFCLVFYRAMTQPIAHDEALTFVWFLDGGVYRLLQYNANNHVLFTLLAKVFVKFFGVSELSLRAPTLIAAVGYLLGVYFLCKTIFEDGLIFLLALAMLCVNPQIMDFLIAARGYGLGISCLSWGMYFLAKASSDRQSLRDGSSHSTDSVFAALFLALAVAANLTNLIPVISLGIAFYLVDLSRPLNNDGSNYQFKTFGLYFIIPGAALTLAILWPFLIQARPAQFHIGSSKLTDFLRDAFNSSFLYKSTADTYSPSLGASPPLLGSWQARVSDLGAFVLLPLLLTLVFVGIFRAFRRSRNTSSSYFCRLFGVAAVGSVLITAALHFLARANYPTARTGLCFVVLFTIGTLLSVGQLMAHSDRRFRFAGVAISLAIIFTYLSALHTSYFRYNAYDSVSRALFLRIAEDAKSRGLAQAQVGGTWWYQPEIDFYRKRYNANWMLPYEIKDPSSSWETPNLKVPSDYDYFVFTAANDPHLAGQRIFHDSNLDLTVIRLDK